MIKHQYNLYTLSLVDGLFHNTVVGKEHNNLHGVKDGIFLFVFICQNHLQDVILWCGVDGNSVCQLRGYAESLSQINQNRSNTTHTKKTNSDSNAISTVYIAVSYACDWSHCGAWILALRAPALFHQWTPRGMSTAKTTPQICGKQ